MATTFLRSRNKNDSDKSDNCDIGCLSYALSTGSVDMTFSPLHERGLLLISDNEFVMRVSFLQDRKGEFQQTNAEE